jgi:hypothetical protein
MTESKRSNAAGEKYALRGIYGSEPYWPQEKLKICVTGAGGFIGMRDFFFFCSFFPGRRPLPLDFLREIARVWRVLSLSLFSLALRREERERENVLLFPLKARRRFALSLFLSFSFIARVLPSSSSSSRRSFFSGRDRKSAADSASHHRANFLKTTFR